MQQREARIALDQLQLVVPGIPLELDVAESGQADALEEPEAQPCDLRVPVRNVVGPGPEPVGVLAQLPLGEVEQRFEPVVEVRVVTAKAVVPTGNDFRHQHVESVRLHLLEHRAQVLPARDHKQLRFEEPLEPV